MYKKDFGNKKPQKNFARVNMNIRAPMVRVVHDGEQLGVMSLSMALKKADDLGLDLIEVVPHASPPVCHIDELGRFRFEQAQKEKDQKKKQRESLVETKEIRLRPGTDDHDLDTKVKLIRRFIEEKKKVQLNLDFKHREMAHKEEGFEVINKVLEAVGDIAVIEQKPKLEGRRLIARLGFKVEK
jgi:translation initiation factor IF-3